MAVLRHRGRHRQVQVSLKPPRCDIQDGEVGEILRIFVNVVLPVSREEAKRLLKELLRDPELRALVEEELSTSFAPKQSTEDHLQKLYRELIRLRRKSDKRWAEYQRQWQEYKEEQERKWQEQQRKWEEQQRRWDEQQRRWEELKREQEERWAEQQRRWDEQQRRWEEQEKRWAEQAKLWEEQNRRWEEQEKKWRENQDALWKMLEKLQELDRLYHTSITAIGARWGYATEEAFRSALKAFLEEDFGVRVQRYLSYDPQGRVFGRPASVEIDLIVYNSKTILAEIKSSVSEADVHAFLNKVAFYEEKEGKKVSRRMIISPMVHPKAQKLAEANKVEVYAYLTEPDLAKGRRRKKS